MKRALSRALTGARGRIRSYNSPGKNACHFSIASPVNSFLTSWVTPGSSLRRVADTTYVGRPKQGRIWEYYNDLALSNSSTSPLSAFTPSVDEDSEFSLLATHDPTVYCGTQCKTLNLMPGDVIEAIDRQGVITFAVVVNPSLSSTTVSAYTLNGTTVHVAKRSVSFLLRGLIRSDFLHFAQSSDQEYRLYTTVQNIVTDFIYKSLQLAPRLEPYVHIAYARHALSNRVRGIDFITIVQDVMQASRQSEWDSLLSSFALYLCLNHPKSGFGRIPDTNDIVVIPESMMDNYSNVSTLLDNNDSGRVLSTFKSNIEAGTVNDSDSRMLIDFLKGYIIMPNPRHESTVSLILSTIYPHRDSDTWLTSVSSAHELLDSIGAWTDNTNPFNHQNIRWNNDANGTEFTDRLNLALNSKDYAHRKRWNTQLTPVYSFKGHDDIGVSIDTSKRDLWTLHIHLIDVNSWIRPDPILLDMLMGRAKSWCCGPRLLPTWFSDRVGFNANGPKRCVTFSVDILPWDPTNWNSRAMDVTLTLVDNVCVLNPSSVESTMGWQSRHSQWPDILESVRSGVNSEAKIDLSRDERLFLSNLKSILEKHSWWRTEHNAITEDDDIFSTANIINEMRICAGKMCALIGNRHQLHLPFRTPHGANVVSGTLPPQEVSELGLPDGYVDVGSPFDNVVSIVAQSTLRWFSDMRHLHQGGKQTDVEVSIILDKIYRQESWANSSKREMDFRLIEAQTSLIDYYDDRLKRYERLNTLGQELHEYGGVYVFRCTILEDGEHPNITRAYCHELEMTVEIKLSPATFVTQGDRVVCNEIIVFSPVDGLLVLGL
uniref:ARAD1C43362p n=1 Tax=Blastobotrys adeninivorans TaxID=409370 RepID=A0A060T4R7_BLAAD